MKKHLWLPLIFLSVIARAQMWNGTDTLYGNEWIDYSKQYFKIKVAEDGVYRIVYQTLVSAGIPVSDFPAGQFRLYRYGVQEPLYTTTNDVFSSQDFLEFYGRKNRDEVDRYLFGDADKENINPSYSLINDTATYYLTWEMTGSAVRYTPVPNDLNNLPPKTEFCWWTSQKTNNQYFIKRKRSDEITFSWFEGDGFCQDPAAATTQALSTNKLYVAGPPASMTVRYVCTEGAHHQRITVNDTTFAEDNFSNWKIVTRNFSVPLSIIQTGANVKVQSLAGASDKQGVAEMKLVYPRLFEFDNLAYATFSLDPSASDQYIEIQSFATNGGNPILYDLDNNTRIETTAGGGVVKAKIPPSAIARRFVLVSPSAVKTVSALAPVQFRNYASETADYVILSNPVLFSDPAAGGADHVKAFADYRESAAGGNHQVLIADVNELYEQFSYGVRYHPIAVRNFLHWAKKQWPGLKHAFIIGKGMDYSEFRDPGAQAAFANTLFFVPTYGSPAADIPFALNGNTISEPIVAIGRLAVTKASDIGNYLEKVKSHDLTLQTAAQTIEDKAWMKRVIHNSGGLAGESSSIRTYINDMANTLSNNRFGADVHTYYKTSNDPIQLSSYEQMLEQINAGVSIWTIYGHSSAFAVDFDIGSPSVYNNKGRYPLMLVMGCFSGLCSSPQAGIGEQYLLAPDRGAIAYIASVNYSYIVALHTYGMEFYNRLGGNDYGKSVGEILQHTVGSLKGTNYDGLIALLHQNLLQGDPAIQVHPQEGPDYLIDGQTVAFNPNPVGLEQSNFNVQFDLANIGQNTGGNLTLKIEQRLPDNTVITRKTDTIQAPPFRRSLDYTLPVSGSKIGFNRFFVTVDPENKIDEKPFAAEQNNDLRDATGEKGADVYFYSDDVQPVYPSSYGIVSKPEPTLFASTLNTNAKPLRYLFEFDTLETFDSPYKKTGQVVQRGGLLSWKPAAVLKDSAVYYWRVARDSLVNGAVVWRTRSFIYLPGSPPGWNQSDFGQYRDGLFANMHPVDTTRSLEFLDNAAFISMNLAYRDKSKYPGFQNSYYEGFIGDFGWNVRNMYDGVAIVVANSNTGRFVLNPEQGQNTYDKPNERFVFWFHTRDSLERIKLMQFIETGIPDGYYAGLIAFGRYWDTLSYAPRLWAADSVSYGKNLFSVLEAQGGKKVRQLLNYSSTPHPYGLIFRKNDPFYPAQDTMVSSIDSVVTMRGNFLAKWTNGLFETPVLGPAKMWKSLHWKRDAFDDPSDYSDISVWSVREGQSDSLLLRLNTPADTSLNFIPAGLIPRIKLRYNAGDTLTRSLTQPQYLRVLYDGLPEGALHPVARYDFYRDTLQQGETMKAAIAFANVSDTPFDSLLVKFKVENTQNNGPEFLKKFRPLLPGDTLAATLSASTEAINGAQRLLIDINPNNAQPEQYHFNNVAVQDFYVARDMRNPLLDVTFDGAHILDGDVISPKPEIIVTLKDDNRFLAMTDTGTFSLSLEMPDGSVHPLAFSDPAVLFIPASGADLDKKNQARLEWRPTFTIDGDYRLRVNGRDASGNESAKLDYSITFKVITRSSISNILNYPNPFSTRTCFVYTMTGAETPAHFKIQIMTVSGRVVREVTENEFGPLQAGTHQSSFCWDGKDEFGDQLANGVYLYRVIAQKSDGSDFEFFENTNIDGFFKQGFGKMVLMR